VMMNVDNHALNQNRKLLIKKEMMEIQRNVQKSIYTKNYRLQ